MALSLRLKIILAFLAVGSVTTALLSWSVYRVMDNGLLRQMQGRVLDLAVIASHLVDTDALARLCSGLAEDLPASAVDAAETSADFASISAVLNEVRGLEERLVHYIYIFAPTADPAKALYVVDADVLADRQTAASGAAVSEEISHYASVFDISSYPVAREALARRTAQVERAWSYDATSTSTPSRDTPRCSHDPGNSSG
jgi:hypothetical protein